MLALVGAIAGFLVTIPLWTGFDVNNGGMQFVELKTWIPRFNINYHLGVDGISMLFVILNAFITIIVVAAGWEVIKEKVAQYNAAFLIMSGLMNGIFTALDGVLFYVFFEASLIPLYLIIGVWGGPNRVYAAFKFFLYTLFGSLLFLLALMYLFIHSGGSFSILEWHKLPIALGAADLAVPGLPDRLCGQGADVAGAYLVAGCSRRSADRRLHRAGCHRPEARRLRFPALLAADRSGCLARTVGLVVALSLIAVVYIGFVALVQDDMKKLVAYSSIAHMGFVTLGFFMFSAMGIEGALVQMVSHGFVSGAMFFCIGVMYDRVHSRQIADYGGVVNKMPKFAALFMLFTMANAGLPATSGFVGEFMVILGAVKFNFWVAFAAASVDGHRRRLLAVDVQARDLRRRRQSSRGRTDRHQQARVRHSGSAGPVATLWMGVYPQPFTEVMHASVNDLLRHVAISKIQ
jgi:NADH-quinone oxidoreductase subunit M